MRPFVAPSIRVAIVDLAPQDYQALLASAGTPGVSFHFLFSGNDALRFAKRQQSGLWVINTQLCDMSGFDLAEMLRAVRPAGLVFIIGDKYCLDDEMQALTQGFAKYLCKPLEPSWLLPDSQDFCIPLPANRFSAPVLRVVAASEYNGNEAPSETVSMPEADERADDEQVILPFNPNAPHVRRMPAA